jgi:hypothetical protein
MATTLIRNAVRTDDWNGRGPVPYAAVVKLLRWMADELENMKEDVTLLPELVVRKGDGLVSVNGLNISASVVDGEGFKRRLKEVNNAN